jgi:recombinational DNA repair ATPase RecF
MSKVQAVINGHVYIENVPGDNLSLPLLSQVDDYYEIYGADVNDPKIAVVGNDYVLNYNGVYESTSLKYVGDDLDLNIDEKEFYAFFEKKYFEKREIDQIIKRNSVGPQFDIFEFFNEETKLNSDLCSTGEQKKILISLILAFILLMKSKNINSILLFDEIASHIDGKNLELFFDEIAKIGMQTWYTGTNIQPFQTIENKALFVKL